MTNKSISNHKEPISQDAPVNLTPKPNPMAAWQFLRRLIPGGYFSIGFVEPTTHDDAFFVKPSEQEDFGPNDYHKFRDILFKINGMKSMRNVVFNPNCAGYCEREPRDDNACCDYIAIRCAKESSHFSISQIRNEFWEDMLDPLRRPHGLPLPSSLWNTDLGVSAVWRLTRPVGISTIIDLEDTLNAVLSNDDFITIGGQFHQLPYTVNWPYTAQPSSGPIILNVPYPFCVPGRIAEHDWFAFRWLTLNADEYLGEHDPSWPTALS